MRRSLVVFAIMVIAAVGSGATHVFWYKATDKGYNLQANPGPNIPAGAYVHQGIIMSAGIAQYSGNATDGFFCGNALDDAQGRCGVIWSKDLCNLANEYCCDFTYQVCTAKFRAELRDGWSDDAFCNAGPIAIRCGVADFSGNVSIWGDPGLVAENATWQDFLNPLGSTMGFDMMNPTLEAEETINFTAPAGRMGEAEPSVLDKQFVEIDITDQVNWIFGHTGPHQGSYSGQYAIVFLSTPGMRSTGKINCYADEAASGSQTTMGSDAPWTTDGNTAHILMDTDCPPAVEKDVNATVSASLSQNAPNPFTTFSDIRYNTGKKPGMLKIFSPAGKLVFSRTVSGNGSLRWDAGKLAAGVYLCRLTAGNRTVSRRLMLMR